MNNRDSSSCTSGQTMTRGSWLLACVQRWTRPTRRSKIQPRMAQVINATVNEEIQPVSLVRFVWYFFWLGTVGFGGPIALAGHMQQDLVDGRRWISKQDYVEG